MIYCLSGNICTLCPAAHWSVSILVCVERRYRSPSTLVPFPANHHRHNTTLTYVSSSTYCTLHAVSLTHPRFQHEPPRLALPALAVPAFFDMSQPSAACLPPIIPLSPCCRVFQGKCRSYPISYPSSPLLSRRSVTNSPIPQNPLTTNSLVRQKEKQNSKPLFSNPPYHTPLPSPLPEPSLPQAPLCPLLLRPETSPSRDALGPAGNVASDVLR